jgi:hypothetical protein
MLEKKNDIISLTQTRRTSGTRGRREGKRQKAKGKEQANQIISEFN